MSRIPSFIRALALLFAGLSLAPPYFNSSTNDLYSAKLNPVESQTINVQLLSSDYTFYVRGTDIPNPLVAWAVKPIDQVFFGAFGPGSTVPYPASVGWLGVVMGGFLQGKFQYPTTQVSVSQGQKKLDSYIMSVRTANPKATVRTVSLSQGSLVANAEALSLRNNGTDITGLEFIAAGNPARANGGLAARLPFQINIPGLFIAGGDDINSNPPPTNGPKFVLVTNQYDPFADVPLYLNNPIAIANWVLSFVAGGINAPFPGVGPHTYDYTLINPVNPTESPGAIVKTYGNQADVLLPSPKGYLPITGLLRGIVSQPLIDAVDPFFRSVIETAYDRQRDVSDRSRFEWAPSQSQREANQQSVVEGFNQMVNNFKELSSPATRQLQERSLPTPNNRSTRALFPGIQKQPSSEPSSQEYNPKLTIAVPYMDDIPKKVRRPLVAEQQQRQHHNSVARVARVSSKVNLSNKDERSSEQTVRRSSTSRSN